PTLHALPTAAPPISQHFPADGWVEHDVEEIWQSTLRVCREALAKAAVPASQVAAVGITNQRETAVVWNRKTGRPIYRAIVWQERDRKSTRLNSSHVK